MVKMYKIISNSVASSSSSGYVPGVGLLFSPSLRDRKPHLRVSKFKEAEDILAVPREQPSSASVWVGMRSNQYDPLLRKITQCIEKEERMASMSELMRKLGPVTIGRSLEVLGLSSDREVLDYFRSHQTSLWGPSFLSVLLPLEQQESLVKHLLVTLSFKPQMLFSDFLVFDSVVKAQSLTFLDQFKFTVFSSKIGAYLDVSYARVKGGVEDGFSRFEKLLSFIELFPGQGPLVLHARALMDEWRAHFSGFEKEDLRNRDLDRQNLTLLAQSTRFARIRRKRVELLLRKQQACLQRRWGHQLGIKNKGQELSELINALEPQTKRIESYLKALQDPRACCLSEGVPFARFFDSFVRDVVSDESSLRQVKAYYFRRVLEQISAFDFKALERQAVMDLLTFSYPEKSESARFLAYLRVMTHCLKSWLLESHFVRQKVDSSDSLKDLFESDKDAHRLFERDLHRGTKVDGGENKRPDLSSLSPSELECLESFLNQRSQLKNFEVDVNKRFDLFPNHQALVMGIDCFSREVNTSLKTAKIVQAFVLGVYEPGALFFEDSSRVSCPLLRVPIGHEVRSLNMITGDIRSRFILE